MKGIYFILILFMNTAVFAQVVVQVPGTVDVPIKKAYKNSANSSEISDNSGLIYTSSGQDFRQYFSEKYQFPDDALNNEISGYIKIEFVVEKTGIPSEIKVIKSLCESCDAEAIRVIESAKFQVCEIDGVPSRCRYNFPIKLAFE